MKNTQRFRWLSIVALLFFFAPTLFAGGLDINNPPGSHPVGTTNPRTGICSLTGGSVRSNSFWPWIIGDQYLANYIECAPCAPVQIQFDEPVDNVKFFIIHLNASRLFELSDDRGHVVNYSLENAVFRHDGHWINWPYNGVKRISIRPHVLDHYYAIDAITWGATTGGDPAIQFRFGEDPKAPGDANLSFPFLVTPSTKVRIPLGRTFTLTLRRKNAKGMWEDVPSSFYLSETHVFNDGPARPEQTLFPEYPLFIYGSAPDAASRVFQSLRLGDAKLTITPSDSGIAPVSFPIESAEPYRLGSFTSGNKTDWDGIIWTQAHLRGIPPQYIKAIADHESKWNTHSWRYEPGADRKFIVPGRTSSAQPYRDYVLPTPAWDEGGILMGRWLCPASVNAGCGFVAPFPIDDLSPKGVLNYKRQTVRPIPVHDLNAHITIREICDANPGQNWIVTGNDPDCPPPPPPATTTPPGRRRPIAPPDAWRVTANPHLASSYGLMQSTWYSVVENKIWEGSNPPGESERRLNPALLFDTDANLSRGSASLIVGPNELRYQFVWRNFQQNYQAVMNPIYESATVYRAHMRKAIMGYNGAGLAAVDYADNLVLPLVPKYEAVFSNSTPIVTTTGGGGGAVSCTAAPTVTAQSTSVMIEPGGEATLSVSTPDADEVAWYRGAVGNLSDPVTTGNWVVVSPSTTTSYWAELTNACGVTRVPATVTIGSGCADAWIASISPDQTIAVGAPIAITATAGGSAVSYQWYSKLSEDDPPQIISGANGPTLNVTPLVSTTYVLYLTSACGTHVSPDVHVTVTPCTPPAITAQPSGSAIVAGAQATLSVGVSGSAPLTIQWKNAAGTVVGNGATIPVQPSQTTSYDAVVSNPCGSVTSATATVTVCQPPAITTQPQNLSLVAGQSGTLSVTATGSGLTYQWYQGGAAISGETASALQISPMATATYHVVVTNSCAPTTSVTATVTVCHPPSITTPPQSAAIVLGESKTLTVTAGGSPTLTYQWFANGTAIPGATASSLLVTPASTSTYTVTVTNSCGSTSSAATITVCHPPTITTQPQNVSIIAGQTATLSVAASGGMLTYQWYKNGVAITGATSSSFSTTAPITANYSVVVSNDCAPVTSATATVSVCTPPDIQWHSPSQWLVKGATRELTVEAPGTGMTYRWYRGAAGDTANQIGNSFSVFVAPADTTSYWARVTNGCASDNTATIVVSVCATPVITLQPQSQNIFSGTTTMLSVTATQATSTPMTYQWYSGSGTANPIAGATSSTYTTPTLSAATTYWVRITAGNCSVDSAPATVSMCSYSPVLNAPDDRDIALGETARLQVNISPIPQQVRWYRGVQGDRANQISAVNFVDVSPTTATQYWGEFTHDGCAMKSRTVTVHVSIPTITQQPAAATQVNGGQSATLTVAANTTGLTYQWYSGTSGSGTPIGGATGATYVTPALAAGSAASYWVKVTGSRGHAVNSNTASVTWCTPASISHHPFSASIRRGSSVSMTVTASGTNLRYQWYRATSPSEVNGIASATSSQYNVVPLDTENYWVKVTSDCGVANSTTARIDVCLDPTINTQPASQFVNSGSTATLSVAATANTTLGLSYQWYSGTSGSGTPISGATAATYTTPALTAAANYWVKVMSGICSTNSATAAMSICSYPATINAPADRKVRSGVATLLSISLNPTPQTFKWYRGAQGDRSNLLSTQPSINVFPTVTTQYWGEFTNNGCTTKTRTVTIDVCVPTITAQPQSVTIPYATTATMSVSATQALTYQWYKGSTGQAIAGATSATYTTPVLHDNESYWVTTTGSCGVSTDSDWVHVTVQ